MIDIVPLCLIHNREQIATQLGDMHFKEFGRWTATERRNQYLSGNASSCINATYVAVDGYADLREAIAESRVLGSIRVIEDDGDGLYPDLTPWLATLYVKPECRKLGVGAKLMRHALKQAVAMQITTMYLWTSTQKIIDNFYRPMGWQEIAKSKLKRSDHFATIMKFDLKKNASSLVSVYFKTPKCKIVVLLLLFVVWCLLFVVFLFGVWCCCLLLLLFVVV